MSNIVINRNHVIYHVNLIYTAEETVNAIIEIYLYYVTVTKHLRTSLAQKTPNERIREGKASQEART